MATNQTIEIRLIVKDEVSKAVQGIYDSMQRRDAQLNTGRAREGMMGLHRGVQAVHRELSSLARLSLGGLIGGGVVAGIFSAGQALQEFAAKGLQLHYTAQSLGVGREMLTKYSDAMMALGQSQEEASKGIESAVGALRDLQTYGAKSQVWEELGKGAHGSGIKLRNELRAAMVGPDGAEGALRLLLYRMQGMKPEGQRAIAKMFGLGSVAASDLLDILPRLNKRVQLSVPEQKELALANANLQISWGNIQTTLAQAFIPTFAKLATSIDQFLQSPNGQAFVEQLKAWGEQLSKAVDEWLAKGGLNKAATDLSGTIDTLKSAFDAADAVVQAMGASWTGIIATLVGLKFASWLSGIALQLWGISRIPGLLRLLGALGVTYGAARALKARRDRMYGAEAEGDPDPYRKPFTMEDIHTRLQGGTVWDRFRQRGGGSVWEGFKNSIRESLAPEKQSGTDEQGADKTAPERRADLLEKRRANRELTEEFGDLKYSLAKLNDYIMPGGPEGGKGSSGYQFPQAEGQVAPASSPFAGMPLTALPKLPGTRLTGVSAGLGAGSFFGNYQGQYNWGDPMDRPRSNALGVPEAQQGISLSSRQTLGQYHKVTDPLGREFLERQTDTGPGKRLQRLVDVAGPAAERMGFTPQTFPTDQPFKVEPSTLNLESMRRSVLGLPSEPFAGVGGEAGREARAAASGGGPRSLFEGMAPGMFGEGRSINDITRELAGQGGGGVLNGSASVDIDVSDLATASRNGNDLFKPSPLEGAVQMQSPSHVPYNPPSYQ